MSIKKHVGCFSGFQRLVALLINLEQIKISD